MTGVEKLLPEHKQRHAFVYARQSTIAQVFKHRTSTERQVELTGTAAGLGWTPAQVELIADDLGRSGKYADNREGFQRLATEVSLGRVGAIFSLDASRLARSSADWHRLIEIAALTRTLLVGRASDLRPTRSERQVVARNEGDHGGLRAGLASPAHGRWSSAPGAKS
jgi:hypothetical protein